MALRLLPAGNGGRWRLGALLATLAVVVVGAPLLRRHWLMHRLLAEDAPAGDALDAVVAGHPDPFAVAEKLWQVDSLIHRRLAYALLSRTPIAYERARPLLVAGLRDVDVLSRVAALNRLLEARDPANLPHFGQLTTDPDPLIRRHALRALAIQGDVACASWVLPLLDDPNRDVVASAAGALRRWTDADFDLRYANADEAAAVASARARWQQWFAARADSLGPPPMPAAAIIPPPIHCPPLQLHDIHGERLTLDFHRRDRPLVLAFWSAGEAPCQDYLEDLRQLHADNAAIEIILINVDGTPAKHAAGNIEHDHGNWLADWQHLQDPAHQPGQATPCADHEAHAEAGDKTHDHDAEPRRCTHAGPAPADDHDHAGHADEQWLPAALWPGQQVAADLPSIIAAGAAQPPMTLIIAPDGRLAFAFDDARKLPALRAMLAALAPQPR